jgi:hypothetical protein
MSEEQIARALSLENARAVLDGTLVDPEPGTLAAAIKETLDAWPRPATH